MSWDPKSSCGNRLWWWYSQLIFLRMAEVGWCFQWGPADESGASGRKPFSMPSLGGVACTQRTWVMYVSCGSLESLLDDPQTLSSHTQAAVVLQLRPELQVWPGAKAQGLAVGVSRSNLHFLWGWVVCAPPPPTLPEEPLSLSSLEWLGRGGQRAIWSYPMGRQ